MVVKCFPEFIYFTYPDLWTGSWRSAVLSLILVRNTLPTWVCSRSETEISSAGADANPSSFLFPSFVSISWSVNSSNISGIDSAGWSVIWHGQYFPVLYQCPTNFPQINLHSSHLSYLPHTLTLMTMFTSFQQWQIVFGDLLFSWLVSFCVAECSEVFL